MGRMILPDISVTSRTGRGCVGQMISFHDRARGPDVLGVDICVDMTAL